jgi:hypothetical protein
VGGRFTPGNPVIKTGVLSFPFFAILAGENKVQMNIPGVSPIRTEHLIGIKKML